MEPQVEQPPLKQFEDHNEWIFALCGLVLFSLTLYICIYCVKKCKSDNGENLP